MKHEGEGLWAAEAAVQLDRLLERWSENSTDLTTADGNTEGFSVLIFPLAVPPPQAGRTAPVTTPASSRPW
jgi:hypothetical protein